jgi:hypothetical protein
MARPNKSLQATPLRGLKRGVFVTVCAIDQITVFANGGAPELSRWAAVSGIMTP